MQELFGPVVTAMVTPFAEDGSVNYDVAGELARRLVAESTTALVVAGSTGEGPALSDEEKLELFRAVAGAVPVPVLAGSTFANTENSVALTRQVKSTGAAAVLATTPAYSRPNQAGILAHLGAIADSTDLPVMVYDIPSRTGRKLAASTTIALARNHRNVVALKDASGDLATAATVRGELGDGFALYSGDDRSLLDFLSIGAVGIVSVAAHWAGPEFAALVAAYRRGDLDEARRLDGVLTPSYDFESTDDYPNPMPTKAILRVEGVAVGECRPPHGTSDDALNQRAREVLDQLRATRG